MQKVQLDLPIILPHMESGDQCTELLTERLHGLRGVDEAHIVRGSDSKGDSGNGSSQLCIHFDANLVSLERVQRLARETGAAVTDRYRHEQMGFAGLNAADATAALEAALNALPGMLHASVSYAAGLLYVAYDSEILDRTRIEQTVRTMGAHLVGPVRPRAAQNRAASHPRDAVGDPRHEEEQTDEHEHDHGSAPAFLPHWVREWWTLLLVALAGIFLAVGFFGERFFGLPEAAALLLYILAYVAGGYDVATHAVPGLLRGRFNTDVLMLAAATGAAILGEWEEGAFLLFLFALGHAGEHYALDRARNAVNALGELMPKTARVRNGDSIEEVPVESVRIEDVVVVRPGDRIPVDGEIVRGQSAVDQSPITGESVPVRKGEGDQVFAGTINGDAALDVRVTQTARDNTLSRVMQMVQEAQSQQSPTQQFTERFTRWFVPAVLLITLGVIVVPPLVGLLPLSQSFYRGMLLLVAASPCALAIGTPAAVLAGIGQAARNGVLIKGGVHLENLGSLRAIAFDKTGTITAGRFAVTDVVPFGHATAEELLRVAAAVEQQSSHPLAQAVTSAASERALDLPAADGLENVGGRGVRSRVGGEAVAIGSLRLFEETGRGAPPPDVVSTVERLEDAGRSTMIVRHGNRFLGTLGLADVTREGAPETLQQLRELGIEHLVMLTGDNADVAGRIAAEVGLTDVRAELLPEQKLEAIRELEREHGSIAMVGDGVNDAPSLATATVGLAMGGAGTAVALETADVALMADDLTRLPFAVGLSRASRAIIHQNLTVALGVIALLIVTSVLGWVQLGWAVILHEGSTIVVVLNALRLLVYGRSEV